MNQNRLRPRPAVLAMGEYHPPLAGRSGLRLDFNENTLAPSPAVTAVLHQLASSSLTIYPERAPVEQLVAQHLGLTPDQLLLTNGVDEAIHLVCEAFLSPDHEILIPIPTFAMYSLYAQMTGARVIAVPSPPSLTFPFDALLDAITPRTRCIAFASPNNPTGAIATREQILALCSAAPHSAILVDEAYFHFHAATILDAVSETPNLVVARTFSKAYGLAGLRIGLLAGHPTTLGWIRKVSSPYNVNSIALACLPSAIADSAYLDWYVAESLAARAMLESALDQWQIPRFPSHANFVLFKIGDRHAEFTAAMRSRGILVRDRNTDHGCAGCVRITAGTRDQMSGALAIMQCVLIDLNWSAEEAAHIPEES
jgi:histidinol-phosphate aminotransferase